MTEQRLQKSPLERVLSIVTEVRPGEGATALLLTLNVFLLMTAYLTIKPVREGLILAMKSGAEYKAYMGAAIALTLLIAVPAYARFADRMAKHRLVVVVTLFFASHLVLFFLGSAVEALRVRMGLIFYLWVGVFNMMVVAQFWSFANDLYSEEQGKRLFPLLGVGQTAGALVGSLVAALLLEGLSLGVFQLLVFSAILLGICAALTFVAHTRERGVEPEERPSLPPAVSQKRLAVTDKGRGSGAFRLVFQHRYLRLLALFSLVFTFVNTNGEYMLGKLLKEDAMARVASGELLEPAVKEYLGTAFNRFYLYVGIVTVLLQALVVSRLVKHAGLRLAFFVLPGIALLDASAVAIWPVLGILFVGKVAENSVDYSLNNTLRNILWLPTTQEMKYKAKQAVDTFFVRMGDVSSALLVFVIAQSLGLGVRAFALVNVALVVVWLVTARAIIRENARLNDGARLKTPG